MIPNKKTKVMLKTKSGALSAFKISSKKSKRQT